MSAGAPPLDLELSPFGRVAFGLVQVLRGAGLEVPLGALLEFARALELLGLADPARTYAAGRSTLITRPDDLDLYDRCFRAFFTSTDPEGTRHVVEVLRELRLVGDEADGEQPEASGVEQPGLVRYAARELLRERDFATLTEQEREEAAHLLAELKMAPATRVTRRRHSSTRESREPDLRAVVRRAVRRDGELDVDRYRVARLRPRPLVLLLDVSGSMESYSRELLRFAQVAVAGRRGVEVFTLGTRLTRVTRQLAGVDPDRALKAGVAAIPDLSGGTRLGESLAAFNNAFGVRGVARGAIVVIFSDGIDRGDAELLASELARLRRVAHQLLWVNPLKASPGYAPLARGMAAALPHLDRFVSGHSVAALADLAAIVSAGSVSARRT